VIDRSVKKFKYKMPQLSIARANAVYHHHSKWFTDRRQSVFKSWLSRNDRKSHHNTFAASAVLAYGQPSQRGTKNKCDQPIHGSFLCTFWNFDWQAFFIGILSIQCKIRRDRPTDIRRSTGRSRSTCWPRLTYVFANIRRVIKWVQFAKCSLDLVIQWFHPIL